TLRVAPYALLAGELDASAGTGALAGNDAGAVPNGTTPGTLIDVLYQNRTSGATLAGNVWRSAVQQDAGAPPAWSP
ncbi:MAG: hypothetical protein JO199_02795, partial [Candidatus Eremiobacteraeota bacterium]|nr:hypothetical protein [Candidatus Eremiobacteraeota bacterium]